MGADTTYRDWLVRFGTSSDERVEAAGVWRDRSFDISALESSVTITTVARFGYDGFSGPRGQKLRSMDWDLVIVDEASMIPLAAIVYPLFFLKPWKFIIAGDPFQIEPIVAVEQWKDENIYTLVGLSKSGSFSKPVTFPHSYKVLNLDTQYRSVPAIGEVFSRFSYDGRLRHHRSSDSVKPFKLRGMDIQPVNLIKFPISKYESIYKARRLDNKTPYQTYSALFTFELLMWAVAQFHSGDGSVLRIGVIAPYRAQANILNRLVDSHSSKWTDVEIQVGTIHGFQGDECDIIFTVLNTPPSIFSSPRMFLNKKNILNVAASRARDYLFIILPDDDTVDRGNLRQLNVLEGIVKSVGEYSEIHSHEIEYLIWGHKNYLEENTHSTGHQMVNVYRKPERYYEVRSDDTAVDVQIHEKE
jgi:superfamily I DNA and/or RNA helicase